jgi:hypothetical protein
LKSKEKLLKFAEEKKLKKKTIELQKAENKDKLKYQ